MASSSKITTVELWSQEITPENYGSPEQYYEHIFKQYEIFIEMADRISSRRNLANTFFLTLHTLLLGAAGFLYEKGPQTEMFWLNIFPLIAVIALCYVWWRLLYSYRQLNAAKFKIIGEYEKRLPSSPYWIGEWKALGEGRDSKLYQPLTDIEKFVPFIFAGMYFIGFLAISFI